MPYFPPAATPTTNSSVPIIIASGETFSTVQYKQSLATMVIECNGVIDASGGVLVFVD